MEVQVNSTNESQQTAHGAVVHLSISPDSLVIVFSTISRVVAVRRDRWMTILNEESFGGARFALALHAQSPLFLLVPSGDKPGTSPRKLKVWNSQRRSLIKELSFPSSIEALQWTKREIAVQIDQSIHLFDLRTLAQRASIPHWKDSSCFALCHWNESTKPTESAEKKDAMEKEQRYLLFPSAKRVGWVSVYDCQDMKLVNEFLAHRTAISAIATSRGTHTTSRHSTHSTTQSSRTPHISHTQGKVATASAMGTIVRVFSVPAGEVLFSFRISSLRSVSVSELSFCPRDDYLVVRTAENVLSLCPLFPVKKKAKNDKERETLRRQQREREMEKERKRERRVREQEDALRRRGECVELFVNEDEDGFCHIDQDDDEHHQDEDNGEEREGMGGFYTTQHENDAFSVRSDALLGEREDDAVSVLTEHSLSSTRSTRIDTVVAPSVAALPPPPTSIAALSGSVSQTASSVFSGLMDQSANALAGLSLSSLWKAANTQNIVDATLVGVQKVRNISQEIFDSSGNQVSTARGAVDEPHSTATLHIELDKEIRRPIVHIQCGGESEPDFVSFALVYSDRRVYGSDEASSDRAGTGDVLHLIVISKQGLFRKVNLNSVRYESQHPFQVKSSTFDPRDYYSSPCLSASMRCTLDDLSAYVEDERCFIDL